MSTKSIENYNISEYIINPDKEISKIESGKNEKYTSINIERTADICKEFWKLNEYKKPMCEVINSNLIAWLDWKIDFQALFEEKTWEKLTLA